MEKLEMYKNMLIFKKGDKIYFGNKKYTNSKPKNVRSAKILITKYIKSLKNREVKELYYTKYDI